MITLLLTTASALRALIKGLAIDILVVITAFARKKSLEKTG